VKQVRVRVGAIVSGKPIGEAVKDTEFGGKRSAHPTVEIDWTWSGQEIAARLMNGKEAVNPA
jgi:hypothetical protein